MDLLKLLASETNNKILALLKNEPTYPRRIAAILGTKEQKIVPRLKALETAGLLKSSWTRVQGKNVKIYEVLAKKMELVFGSEGIEFDIQEKPRKKSTFDSSLYLGNNNKLELDPHFVGRKSELEAMSGDANFIVVEGM